MFQAFMNHIFRDMTDIFVVIYLDDILIFSDSLEDHQVHFQCVLEHLREYNLHSKPEKCLFHMQKIEFLGFMATPTGISMDTAKNDVVSVWPTLTNLKAVQVFLGFKLLLLIHCGVLGHHYPSDLPHPQGHPIHLGP